MADEIKLTYETLYEITRLEKTRAELQELSITFFDDASEYLKEKQRILEETKFKTDIFSSAEREKTTTQIRNIKKLMGEIYEKRESKILAMALNKSRTDADIVDTRSLLPEEQKFYECLLNDLNIFRKGILHNLIEMQKMTILSEEEKASMRLKAADKLATLGNIQPEQPHSEPEDANTKIKFITMVDKFFGKELEPYGPYNADEVIELPSEIADVLITNGQAVPI